MYMYMCSYNAEDDQVNCCIRIPMQNVNKIVIGKQYVCICDCVKDTKSPQGHWAPYYVAPTGGCTCVSITPS